MAIPDFDVRTLESCSSQAEVAMWVKHAHMLQCLKCSTRPDVTPVLRLRMSTGLFFLSLHHMCEFYRNG